jgi:glutamyl/glutaminyl-tRNA synthetase
MTSTPIITRFAPSPTGHLHIGGARSALFCWAYAKRMGGRFMLRIEDTDAARSSDESARGIMEDLAWLGIEWDDGPRLELPGGRAVGGQAREIEGGYFQARRLPIYNRELERLVRSGHAYPAFEGSEELDAQRKAATAAKQTYRYPRPADITPGVFNAVRWERAQRGEAHVVRFVAPHEEILVADRVLGDVRIAPGELDDFVLRKADGFPTYHFAVVCDDELMGVTHVLRAQEHLANTPRHVALQRALGFRTPEYGHMPLIFNLDKSKMSKRDKAKAARAALKSALQKDPSLSPATLAAGMDADSAQVAAFIAGENDSLDIAARAGTYLGIALPEIEVADFRANGYVPSAITNYLALLGWNPGVKTPDGKDLEKFDMPYLAANFSLERIGKTNSVFDRVKLASFNQDALAAMSDAEFAQGWLAWMRKYRPQEAARLAGDGTPARMERFTLLAGAVKGRAKTYADALRPAGFALCDDDGYAFDPAAVKKNLHAEDGKGLNLLRALRPALAALEDWSPGPIHAAIEAFAGAHALPNIGGIAQPLRVALAGVAVSPPLGETLTILGKDSTLARIDRCLASAG